MEKIWLKSYPAGVPEEIDETRYNSLSDLLGKLSRTSQQTRVCLHGQSDHLW